MRDSYEIKIERLTNFGGIFAVNDASTRLKNGKIFGLFGPSGDGPHRRIFIKTSA
ncbi:MAG: hypothetical protein ACP5PX_05775 [Candidatus Hadarchaeum sp.]|uniref:hypothetical protein n=1 Tax=Candidatus Hadarchaeum sp. TaxID=2883567 RepID=UPI003D0F2F05